LPAVQDGQFKQLMSYV